MKLFENCWIISYNSVSLTMSYINIIIIYADVQNYNYIDVSGIFFFILGVFRSQDTPSTMAMDNDDNEKIR